MTRTAKKSTIASRLVHAKQVLEKAGQQHVLTFADQLDESHLAKLLDQIEGQDWQRLAELAESHVRFSPDLAPLGPIEPPPYYPATPSDDRLDRYASAQHKGEELIRAGKVAAFMVAGGQGTRLGWDAPKGTFPASPITGKPLFQIFAESILKSRKKYEANVPWYIMTSPLNDQPTRDFFEQHKFFEFPREDVIFFQQGVIPSFALDGKVLLESPCSLATNPDGHGGSLLALHASGALDDMRQRGVEHISYFQVDNPLVRCIDPLFIGLHAQDGAQMSSKMVTKANAGEKVGVFAQWEGKLGVIEYSDLPEELARAKDAAGGLKFIAGSIAIHIIDRVFVEKLNKGGFGLPYHRAVKKVPYVDLSSGEQVEPKQPNAVKLETFVFDALRLCDKSIVLETIRADEFGPIKNAEGVDSAQTSKQLQSDRAARWLEWAGVKIARKHDGGADAVIELSPLTAIDPTDLRGLNLPSQIERGQSVRL